MRLHLPEPSCQGARGRDKTVLQFSGARRNDACMAGFRHLVPCRRPHNTNINKWPATCQLLYVEIKAHPLVPDLDGYPTCLRARRN